MGDVLVIARIYKPSKTAMQSGLGNTKAWVLDFEPEQPRQVEPLMGWTSSGDMEQQVHLRFASKEDAIAYCERHQIAYQVFETTPQTRLTIAYSDNFAFKRRDAWPIRPWCPSGWLRRSARLSRRHGGQRGRAGYGHKAARTLVPCRRR